MDERTEGELHEGLWATLWSCYYTTHLAPLSPCLSFSHSLPSTLNPLSHLVMTPVAQTSGSHTSTECQLTKLFKPASYLLWLQPALPGRHLCSSPLYRVAEASDVTLFCGRLIPHPSAVSLHATPHT